MIPILKREINSFFASSIGYLVIAIFLVINGLFLWVFKGDFNVFDTGFADLAVYFELTPWILLFLIPAVTMRTFSDEKKMGTLELLLTKPISIKNIVLGKYAGAIILIGLALLPTLLYVFTISKLGNPSGNWDIGSTIGSFLGLLFLVFAYVAIGIFASTLSKNQVVAFIFAVFFSFFMYFGFEGISSLFGSSNTIFINLGMKAHFHSVARGVLDSRDLIYFISVSVIFISLTIFKLEKE